MSSRSYLSIVEEDVSFSCMGSMNDDLLNVRRKKPQNGGVVGDQPSDFVRIVDGSIAFASIDEDGNYLGHHRKDVLLGATFGDEEMEIISSYVADGELILHLHTDGDEDEQEHEYGHFIITSQGFDEIDTPVKG